MSTRGMYTFIDPPEKDRKVSRRRFHIYRHMDNYPTGARQAIARALPFAWALPRFEADEFAAAFVAGNKPRPGSADPGGGIRIVGGTSDADRRRFAGDVEYRYEITAQPENKGGALMVKAYSAHCNSWAGGTDPGEASAWAESLLYDGPFEEWDAERTEAEAIDGRGATRDVAPGLTVTVVTDADLKGASDGGA
jgi:hypothetical protein